jgi:hypothetical protein
VQLWTKLEEDPQVQQWDKEEERINATIQEFKKQQKTIPIPERVKGTQELKKLQARTSHCANTETGASGSNRTIAGTDSSNTGAGRRSQNTVNMDSAGMCRTDKRRSSSANSRYYQGENRAGTDKSNRIAGEVPDDH